MGYDVLKRRCAHNKILGKLEHCELCLQSERERAKVKAGPQRNRLEYPATPKRPTHADAWSSSVSVPREALEPTNYEREAQNLLKRIRRSVDEVIEQATHAGLINDQQVREMNLGRNNLKRMGALGLAVGQEFTTGLNSVIGVVRHVNEDGSCLVELDGDVVEQDPDDPNSHVNRLLDRVYGGQGA